VEVPIRRLPAAFAADYHRGMEDRWPGVLRSDALFELDEEYASILALLDRTATFRRITAGLPGLAGVEMAFVGECDDSDRLVLGHTVNARTSNVNGLVVPVGHGLGGQVLARRRPLWVSDYRAAGTISHQYDPQVEAERVGAMVAVPIVSGNRLLGVLYGANRHERNYADREIGAMEHAANRAAAAAIVAERARSSAEIAVHEERRRLALELHDTVGAILFALGTGIRGLEALPTSGEIRTRLEALEQQAVDASVALRRSLHALHAPPEQLALAVTLREDCRAFEQRTAVRALLIVADDLPALPYWRIKALVEASREALLNVEKHAQASAVAVTLFPAGGGVTVAISDDGVGLGGDRPDGNGLGLAAATERLERLGGRLTVTNNDDGGVIVKAWVPS
jgi:LuxR family transcriptional regulator, regulator of acetate metabolism